MADLVAGMRYSERFDVLVKGNKGNGDEVRLVWDKAVSKYAVQDFDQFYHYSDKGQAETLFGKMVVKKKECIMCGNTVEAELEEHTLFSEGDGNDAEVQEFMCKEGMGCS